MKYSLSKTMDRVRKTVEQYTRSKRTDEPGVQRDDETSVAPEEIQLALQELRLLVLEGVSLENAPTDSSDDHETRAFLRDFNESAYEVRPEVMTFENSYSRSPIQMSESQA